MSLDLGGGAFDCCVCGEELDGESLLGSEFDGDGWTQRLLELGHHPLAGELGDRLLSVVCVICARCWPTIRDGEFRIVDLADVRAIGRRRGR